MPHKKYIFNSILVFFNHATFLTLAGVSMDQNSMQLLYIVFSAVYGVIASSQLKSVSMSHCYCCSRYDQLIQHRQDRFNTEESKK